VQNLFGIQKYADDWISLTDHFELFKIEERRMPDNLVPIGDDPGGNLICISVSGKDCGSLLFWNLEGEADVEEGEVASYENVSLIAPSFSAFLNDLFD